jgi:hypothetical protein
MQAADQLGGGATRRAAFADLAGTRSRRRRDPRNRMAQALITLGLRI